MKVVSYATSFYPNYLPLIFVGTVAAIAAIVFTVAYFVDKRRSNQARAVPVSQQIIEDEEKSEMDEVSNTGSDEKYNLDEFDMLSLNSDNDEVTTVKVVSKEFSFISSEEGSPRSFYEHTSIASCY